MYSLKHAVPARWVRCSSPAALAALRHHCQIKMASNMQDFITSAVQARIRGRIEGVEHVAAATAGDGACGLHAVFGTPRRADRFLACANARDVVLSNIPETIEDVLTQREGALRELGIRIMKFVWTDMALPMARAILEGESEFAPEAMCIWSSISERVQDDLLSFAESQKFESAKCMATKEKLLAFANRLFVPQKEASVVRPLCMLLGYVNSAEHDYLRSSHEGDSMLCHEGSTGSLSLLHKCMEGTGLTKYQALFDTDIKYDRYRLAFFINSAHSSHAGQQDWMLSALDTLAVDLMSSGDDDSAALLRQGRQAVEQRYQCFGTFEYPPACTEQGAWAAFRLAIRKDEYWLSVEELQLLGACCGCKVRVYSYCPHAAGR